MSESQHLYDLTLDEIVESGAVPLSGKEELILIDDHEYTDKFVIEFWNPISHLIEVDVIPRNADSEPFSFGAESDKAGDIIKHIGYYATRPSVEESIKVAA